MRKLFNLFVLLSMGILISSGIAFGWGSTGGDGTNYKALQETAVFMNVSNATMYHGDAVILDVSEGTSGTDLGSEVEYTASADSVLVVGVVVSKSENDTPVVVCTKGPVLTRIMDSSDAVTISTAVGTSVTTGNTGGGVNLGVALEAGDGTDSDEIIVWVDPTGAD